MARATLPVQEVTRDGITISNTTLTTGGCKFANPTEDIMILVDSRGIAASTLTVHASGMLEGEPITDRTYAIASGAYKAFGPFPAGIFNTGGYVYIDSTGAPLIAALRLPT